MLINPFVRTMQPYMDAPADPGAGGNPNPNPAPVEPTPPATPPADPGTPPQDPGKPPEPTPEPQKIKIKFNKEEKELTVEEAAQLAQKGMNYDKAVERAKQEARDAYIAEQGYEWQGKPIKTEAEYKAALQESELREKYKELPEEVASEMVENRKFREQWETERQSKAKEEAQKADALAFINAYPDVKFTDLPESVLAEVDKGKSLVDAYRAHENQQLRGQVAKLEESLGIKQKNAENTSSSTGPVTGQGTPQTGFFSRDQVKSMSQTEVRKNYDSIMESMKHWK